jgi:hypothetical protein
MTTSAGPQHRALMAALATLPLSGAAQADGSGSTPRKPLSRTLDLLTPCRECNFTDMQALGQSRQMA